MGERLLKGFIKGKFGHWMYGSRINYFTLRATQAGRGMRPVRSVVGGGAHHRIGLPGGLEIDRDHPRGFSLLGFDHHSMHTDKHIYLLLGADPEFLHRLTGWCLAKM